jgi:DNA-binding response OmpR family regulator
MGQGERLVLVVDDDPDVVSQLRDFLEVEGLAVCGARHREEAPTKLEGRPIACVILDVMLPGPDGFEIARAIREIGDVPILFLSARDADTDKIRGLALGGDDFIVKTASPAEIVARVVGYVGEIKWDKRKPDGAPQKLLDSSRLRAFGWQPAVDLEEGIRNTYSWFIKNGVSAEAGS